MKAVVHISCVLMAAVLAAPAVNAAPTRDSKRTTTNSKRTVRDSDGREMELVSVRNSSEDYDDIGATDGTFRLRPAFGYAFSNPAELNNMLAPTAQAAGVQTAYRLGGAAGFTVAADYFIVKQFSIGARIDYFSAMSDMVTFNNAGLKFSQQAFLTGLPVYATASFNHEVAPRWSIGLTAGLGAAIFYKTGHEVSASNDPTNNPNGVVTYGANPFTAFGSTYLNFDINRRVALRVDAGYRLLTSNTMKLVEPYNKMAVGTPLTNDRANGQNVTVDSSAFTAGLGLAVSL